MPSYHNVMTSPSLTLPPEAVRWRAEREQEVADALLPSLTGEEADPFHARLCPDWIKEELPAKWQPFMARRGLPEPYHSRTVPLGMRSRGGDRWQANHFLVWGEKTRGFIEKDYTPLHVDGVRSSLADFEKLAARFGAGLSSPRERAVAFLTRALPEICRHPTVPPIGPLCATNRGLDDEGVLRSGIGYCNEQARLFIRLCQISGIPARLTFLFYSDQKTGHTAAEFHADGGWALADPSWFLVVPGPGDRLLSTAECHRPENQGWVGEAYSRRMREIAALGDEELAGAAYAHLADPAACARATARAATALRAEVLSRSKEELGRQFWVFAVLNHPLPPHRK